LRWASSDRCPCHRAPCTGPVGCDALPPLSCRTPAKPKENLKKENGKETEKRKGKRMKKEKTAPNAARPNGQPDRPNIFRPIQSCLRTRGNHGKTGFIRQQGGTKYVF